MHNALTLGRLRSEEVSLRVGSDIDMKKKVGKTPLSVGTILVQSLPCPARQLVLKRHAIWAGEWALPPR